MDINQWLRQKVDNSEIHPAIADNFKFVYELFIKEQGNGTESQASRIQGSTGEDSKIGGDTVKKRRSYTRKRNPKSVTKGQGTQPEVEESQDAEVSQYE